MPAGDPRTPPNYRYVELPPPTFEALVFRLAWAEDHRVVRVNAPDGGLDTMLPDAARDGKADRGWQAKRHAGSIDWDDCVRSLDRAVRFWEPREITFVFPRDLNSTEHSTFERRLATRHPGTKVNYWGKAGLDARLDSPEGSRVAAAYFEEHDAVDLAERMLRAGSPLQTGDDFLAAEEALERSLSLADPDYDWVIHRARGEVAEPDRAPGAVLRLSFGRKGVTIHADLVPRHAFPAAMPSVALRLDDTEAGVRAREWLEELRLSGGRLALGEGVDISVTDVPAPFGELLDSPLSGAITVKAVSKPAPFYVRATAGPPDDRVSLDIDLLPSSPSEEWDAALEGRVGGLVLSLRMRWLVHKGEGEFRVSFDYSGGGGAPNDIEASVLRWLLATYPDSEVTLDDRRGERPSLTWALAPREAPEWMEVFAQLHGDLAVLEAFAGRPAPPIPYEVRGDAVNAIATVARILRTRSRAGTINGVTMTFNAAPDLGQVVRDLELRQTLVANVFGHEMPVAREVTQAPPMVVRSRRALPNGEWELQLVPLVGDNVEIVQELVPLAENPR